MDRWIPPCGPTLSCCLWPSAVVWQMHVIRNQYDNSAKCLQSDRDSNTHSDR